MTRKRVPNHERRIAFTVRLPAALLQEFREVCDRLEPRTQTKVIEQAVRRFVARNRSR